MQGIHSDHTGFVTLKTEVSGNLICPHVLQKLMQAVVRPIKDYLNGVVQICRDLIEM